MLLDRSADFLPWLKWLVLVVGLLAAVGLLVADRVGRAVAAALVAVGLLAAPRRTGRVRPGHRGHGAHRLDPERRPGRAGGGFGGAGGRGFGGGRGACRRRPRRGPAAGPAGRRTASPAAAVPGLPGATGGTTGPDRRAGGFGGGGIGGLLDAAEVSADGRRGAERGRVVLHLGGRRRRRQPGGRATSSPPQLPVMPIGGFNGSDPSPDPRAVPAVRRRREGALVHRRRRSGCAATAAATRRRQIASWVEQNFAAQTVDGVTLYDLTAHRLSPRRCLRHGAERGVRTDP